MNNQNIDSAKTLRICLLCDIRKICLSQILDNVNIILWNYELAINEFASVETWAM